MKKILFILILFIMCNIIFCLTSNNKLYYVNIGDFLAKGMINKREEGYGYNKYLKEYLENNHRLKGYSNKYVNSDYRITDIINELSDNSKNKNLAQELKKADIITLSLGMNELYYKLYISEEDIYRYINDMVSDMNILLHKIEMYSSGKVFILGYFNIFNRKSDIFTYINYHMLKLCNKYNYTYILPEKVFNNIDNYLEKPLDYYLNNRGYNKIFNFIVEKI